MTQRSPAARLVCEKELIRIAFGYELFAFQRQPGAVQPNMRGGCETKFFPHHLAMRLPDVMRAELLSHLGARGAGGDLEGEAEPRQVLAGMVVRIGQLWKAVVVRPRLFALVDGGIEIDEMPAGLAGRLHENFDVALAVERAGIAARGVVVDHRIDVGGLAPPHAFEMDPEGCACRPARNIKR